MRVKTLLVIGAMAWAAVVIAAAAPAGRQARASAPATAATPPLFETADRCQACHNGLVTPSGRDVSIGVDWRTSMMAHAARDPYWHAAVRREVLDHPAAASAIEHECSRCHMPMAHVTEAAGGATGQVFAHLSGAVAATPLDALAADGVSCASCHQIQADKLGTPESFTGHFVIDTTTPADQRVIFGPFAIEQGLRQLMHSASTFVPAEGAHIRSSEMCATCHTLYTHALDDDGTAIGTLPEQVPYLEWRHSSFRDTHSCQTCHMPAVGEPVRVSSTMGEPRDDVLRHTFRGANFWMLRVLNRFRNELGVTTLSQELERAAADTLVHLERESALLRVEHAARTEGAVVVDVRVANRGGHKLPTAYPSRRAWLYLRIADESGRTWFESGAVDSTGAIAGNDNDADGSTFEPHHRQITGANDVQIYEAIMADARGRVTTGLLSGVRYVKDNRLLPDGFDKTTAHADIAVHGDAAADPDFMGGSDRVRYRVPVDAAGALTVTAELRYQSVGYRWAHSLRTRPALETSRFVRYYEAMSHLTTATLAEATTSIP
ncbi:MAG TPA: hypothetical protein VF239_10335 [Vicinamibacterales bacterium]